MRVCPIGDIDIATAGSVRDELRALKSAGFKRVVLDLRGTTFLDTSGLHLVVEADASARADGWDFAVIEGPPAVQRAFELAGLLGHLPFTGASTPAGSGSPP